MFSSQAIGKELNTFQFGWCRCLYSEICLHGNIRSNYSISNSPKALWMTQVLDMITDTLYEKTMDAQEGVLFFLLDQMAEQHVKELMLAYFMLLRFGGFSA